MKKRILSLLLLLSMLLTLFPVALAEEDCATETAAQKAVDDMRIPTSFEIVPEDDQVCIRFVNPENDDCQELLEALKDATFDRMMYGFLDSSSDSTERKVYDGVERYY